MITQTSVNEPKKLDERLNFYIKREDGHELGSHKIHAISYQLQKLKEAGQTKAIISSSGNAGIAAGALGKNYGIDVYVLMSDRTPLAKLEAAAKCCDHLFLSKRASRLTNYIAAKYNIHNMKPSMDPLAIEGFKSLGKEIHNQLPKIKELYTFVTSGASFIGIYQSLKENNIQPKMYAVKGIAGKLGTSHSPLQKQVNRILAETGSGTIEIDEETLNKFKMDFPSLQLSDESLSSLAAALQNNAGPNSLVISTGKKWTLQDPAFNPSTIPSINSFEECDNLFA